MRREQEAAFEAFVAGAGSRLLRLAVLLTGDRWHAEDLLQAALERTARPWSRLDGSPQAYAHKVLANLATDRWRRLAARVREVATNDPQVHERAAMTGVGPELVYGAVRGHATRVDLRLPHGDVRAHLAPDPTGLGTLFWTITEDFDGLGRVADPNAARTFGADSNSMRVTAYDGNHRTISCTLPECLQPRPRQADPRP